MTEVVRTNFAHISSYFEISSTRHVNSTSGNARQWKPVTRQLGPSTRVVKNELKV